MPNNQDINKLRHSAAHLLAVAVANLFPGAKHTIGPVIENGFYYDFDLGEHKISDTDLSDIEAEMTKIVKGWNEFKEEKIDSDQAYKLFEGNEYKKELIDELIEEKEDIKIQKSGDFIDLCRGDHIDNPKNNLKHFKLLSVAGAYWRGNEKNKMLTRIYGTAFFSEKELKDYLVKQEQALERDHRKLGRELNLFMFSDLVGPGLPIYKPKGAIIVGEIERFMGTLQRKMGYSHVYSPNISKEDLFEKSGHLQWFKENMYPPMEFEGEGNYYAKPMNCPFHIEIFKSNPRSYKDMPIRYAEFGTVYRYEKSGEIGGLLRTRGFTQDDAHIFCREDQVVDEFIKVFEFTKLLLDGLGLTNYRFRFSLRGEEKEKYAGNEKQWEKATALIREALDKAKIKFVEAKGEAAFYGPKLDILFTDSIGREWQISTIQVDFLLPERFDLNYIDKNGNKVRPYMIHRAPLGSRERIMATLIEHYAGAFPTWLSPVQTKVIPVSEKNILYAQKVHNQLLEADIRSELDDRNEPLGARIRDAQIEKVSYMLIVGLKEEKDNTISVRARSGKDLGSIKLNKLIMEITNEIKEKRIT